MEAEPLTRAEWESWLASPLRDAPDADWAIIVSRIKATMAREQARAKVAEHDIDEVWMMLAQAKAALAAAVAERDAWRAVYDGWWSEGPRSLDEAGPACRLLDEARRLRAAAEGK
jgi:hypothetical protein